MSTIHDLFARLGDRQVPGGCDRCDSYQTLSEELPGLYALTVHHDDDCPTWRAMNAEAN
jgi:hypothetical protein